MAHQTFNPC